MAKSSIYVVKDTCARHYIEKTDKLYDLKTDKNFNILTLSSYYPHKNLDIIPYIAKQLKIMGYDDFQFIITIVKDTPEERNIFELCESLDVVDHIKNIGLVNIIDGPALYAAVDIVLQQNTQENGIYRGNPAEYIRARKFD